MPKAVPLKLTVTQTPSRDEPLSQLGICPSCSSDTEQRLLFAQDENEQPIIDRGQIVAYHYLSTYSLFRCQRCEGLLFFVTSPDVPWPFGVDELLENDSNWIAKLTPAQFLDDSSLLWPKRRVLPWNVPNNIRKVYERALKVKEEPNSFAVQIRRALEAICIDRGEPGKKLHEDLENLSKVGVFPPIVAEIAHELRDIGNTGAHVRSRDVEDKQVEAIDEFFHLVVNYVYEAPARLEDYRKLLKPEPKFNKG